MAQLEIFGYQSENIQKLASGGWFTYPWGITFTENYIYISFDVNFSVLPAATYSIFEGVEDPSNGIRITAGPLGSSILLKLYFTDALFSGLFVSTGVDYSVRIRYAHATQELAFGLLGNYFPPGSVLAGANFNPALNSHYKFSIENGTIYDVGTGESNLLVPTAEDYDFFVDLNGDFDPTFGTVTSDSGGPFIESYKLIV